MNILIFLKKISMLGKRHRQSICLFILKRYLVFMFDLFWKLFKNCYLVLLFDINAAKSFLGEIIKGYLFIFNLSQLSLRRVIL